MTKIWKKKKLYVENPGICTTFGKEELATCCCLSYLNVGGYQLIVNPGSGDIATVKMQHEINLPQKIRKFFFFLLCAETFLFYQGKTRTKLCWL